MSTHICVDGNCYCHRVWYELGGLKYDGESTGVVFGFLTALLKLARVHRPCSFSFAWDSKQSLRRDLFPEYKIKRRTEREKESEADQLARRAAYRQFGKLRTEILPALGFKNVFCWKGLEGDDVMAAVALKLNGPRTGMGRPVNDPTCASVLLATTDEDLYQMLDHCNIVKPSTLLQYTRAHLLDEYGCTPDEWGQAKIIAGCNSDEVPGVAGVGMKTAIKFMKNKLGHNTKTYRDIMAAPAEMMQRNHALVILPHKRTPVPKLVSDGLDIRGLKDVCAEYGLKSLSTAQMLDKWKEAFRT